MHFCGNQKTMKFRRRLLLFATGLTIGRLLVFMMFPNYDWLGWLPGKQIMKQIQASKTLVTNHGKCRMDCQGISMENFESAKWGGEVDFSKSDAQNNPKRYFLSHNNVNFIILCTDSTVTVAEASREGEKTKCDCAP